MKTIQLSPRAEHVLINMAQFAFDPYAQPVAETKAIIRRIVWTNSGETSDEAFQRLRKWRKCGEKTALEILKLAGFARPRRRRKPTVASLKAQVARLKKRIREMEQAARAGHNP